MANLNILLLGSGGRECALAWKMSQSARLGKLFIAPGNGGTGAYGENVALSPLDFPAVRAFVIENHIDMVVVGNEDPRQLQMWKKVIYKTPSHHFRRHDC